MNDQFQILQLPRDIAFQACSRCHKQKRKCDRKLPQCSLCIHLGRKCHYPLKSCDSTPSPDRLQLPIDIFSPCRLSVNIPAFVRSILESPLLPETEIAVFTKCYSQKIHPWFPVLPWEYFQRQIPSFWSEGNDTGCLLVLTVYLLTQHPIKSAHSREILKVYESIKGMLGFLEGSASSLDAYGLQCRILIALFELGHDLRSQAYVSIAGAVRIAYDRYESLPKDETEDRICISEPKMSWWAVLILDRYIALQQEKPSASAGLPSDAIRPQYLPGCDIIFPKDDNTYSLDHEKNPHNLQAFLHLFHASHLLSQVLTHTRAPTPEFTFNMEEALRIVVTIDAFANLISSPTSAAAVTETTPDSDSPDKESSLKQGMPAHFTSPLPALLNGTFLLLYTFGHTTAHTIIPPSPDYKIQTTSCATTASIYLRENVNEILDACKQFNALLLSSSTPCPESQVPISPFAIHAVSAAAQLYQNMELASEKDDEGKRNEDLKAFSTTLGLLGEWWESGLSEKKNLDVIFGHS